MISTKLITLLVFSNIRTPKGMRYDSKLYPIYAFVLTRVVLSRQNEKQKILHGRNNLKIQSKKIEEKEAKSIPLTHKYMTAHFHLLVQTLQ